MASEAEAGPQVEAAAAGEVAEWQVEGAADEEVTSQPVEAIAPTPSKIGTEEG